jgi:putative ABC transport system permease protein
MLGSAYKKNIRREINSTRSRFLSIFGIVMLGVAILTGLMSVAPDMRAAARAYFRQSRLCDLRVVSTLGLTQEDIEKISATQGVSAVMPAKTVECEVKNENGDTLVMRAHSLPENQNADAPDYLNQLELKEGRMPEKPGECAVQGLGFINGIALGDTVTLNAEADGLEGLSFTVVGVVQNPMNFSIDRETSTAGDGNLDFVAYMPQSCFTKDYYTICYLAVEGAEALDPYGSEYDACVSEVSDRLEALGDVRTVLRRQQVVDDAQVELDEAKQEYDDKKAEADEKLADAENELDDAQKTLNRTKARLDQGERDYQAGKDALAARRETLPDTLSDSAGQILVNEGSVLDFSNQVSNLGQAITLIASQQTVLAQTKAQLQAAQAVLANLAVPTQPAMPADPSDSAAMAAYANAMTNYANSYQNYMALKGYLEGQVTANQQLLDAAQQTVDTLQKQLDTAKQALYDKGFLTAPDLSNTELQEQAQAKLKEMQLALTQGQLSIATAYGDLEKAEQQLEASREQLDDGWKQYDDGVQKLADARAEYETKKADAERELSDAEQKISDAQADIDDIAACKWYLLDRGTIRSFVTFQQNADRIADIAKVFPVFFFLVAALVALTTMTRMVEENRLQIGTLKALGYSEAAISAKYLLYALAASFSGAAAGVFVGFIGFPSVIWYAYSIMYSIPTFHAYYDPTLIAVSFAASVVTITAATMSACHATLSEKPAVLMLPKAPPAGRRILLEWIPVIWNRMSFSYKVTARNLLRYKKRFFMTVLGVAGCTALLLVGFGIQDSIMDILDDQFTRLNHYDLQIDLSSEKALTESHGLSEILSDTSAVADSAAYYLKTVTIQNAGGEQSDITLTMCSDNAAAARFFTFQTRLGHEPIPYGKDSVILTEKTAETLGISAGDTIKLERADGTQAALTVTGVTENYINSRLFIAPELYEKQIGPLPGWNTVFALTTCGNDLNACNALNSRILTKNYISSASFIEDLNSSFSNVIGSINYVVLLVIVCAALLAAVVLYNLVNINLAERRMELATIKVLGFYDKEVHRYIFREIDILSLIGSLVGIGIGVPLHQYIIRTVEIDQMMFIRSIAPSSYFYSVALTMLFTVIITLFMHRHVDRISMVESMKAPE